MDLASMLKREDFFALFFPTLEEYFSAALGKTVKISFSDGARPCNMVIKPRLSAATAVIPSRVACGFFYSEWNIRGSLVKYLAGKGYVFAMTHTGKLFSQYRLHMEPPPSRNLVIAPNNRSIRVFDYGEGTVGCIVKQGFSDKYFKNQLEFREKYDFPFLLPMLRHGDNWFVERILLGHPLARVTDPRAYKKGTDDAMAALAVLAAATHETTDSKAYSSSLAAHVDDMLTQAERRKKIRTAKLARRLLALAVQEIGNHPMTIPTCMSHGDFQSGNIWVDATGETLLYDWETAGRRCVWYDAAVLNYSLRRNGGWETLMDDPEPRGMLSCDIQNERSPAEWQAIKYIVLLEDLAFYLEDMLELPEDWGAAIFDRFLTGLAVAFPKENP